MSARSVSLLLVGFGIVLIVLAHWMANSIPQYAVEDLDAYFVSLGGGGIVHSPGFPETYRQMCASRRLLQNSYIGAGGLILLTAGIFGFLANNARTETKPT
jgi:hypothetical protein